MARKQRRINTTSAEEATQRLQITTIAKEPFLKIERLPRTTPSTWYQLLEELYVEDTDASNQTTDNRTTLQRWSSQEIEEDIVEETLEPDRIAKKISTQKCELTTEQQHIMELDNSVIDYIYNKLKQNNELEAANKIQNFLTALNKIREYNTSDTHNIFRNHTILHLAQKADKYLGYDMPEIFNIIVENTKNFPKTADYLEVRCLCSKPGELLAAAIKHDEQNNVTNRESILNKLLKNSKQETLTSIDSNSATISHKPKLPEPENMSPQEPPTTLPPSKTRRLRGRVHTTKR